jgi:ABC-2 type transport system ATP-binding protein
MPCPGFETRVSIPIIETQEITKRFKDVVAVDHLTLRVEQGEVFGLLGQNGSGKTTLIRMLNTLWPLTSGKARVCGHDVERQSTAVRRAIGVVPQALTSDIDLTAMENMDIYGRFYEVPSAERKQRIKDLIKRVGLWEFRNKLVGAFSGGMRRRLEIARGLIHRPKLLILDEPTIGLDPNSRRNVWNLLEEFKQEMDLTVLLTTHYLDEAEHLCGRVGMIDKGQLKALGSPKELCSEVPWGQRINLKLDRADGEREAFLAGIPGVEQVRCLAGDFELVVAESASALTAVVDGCRQRGYGLQTIALRNVTLEDAFIHFVGHELHDEVAEYRPGAPESY